MGTESCLSQYSVVSLVYSVNCKFTVPVLIRKYTNFNTRLFKIMGVYSFVAFLQHKKEVPDSIYIAKLLITGVKHQLIWN